MFIGENLLYRLRKLLQKDFGYGAASIQTDISNFDRDIPVWLLEQAFRVLEALLNFSVWEGVKVAPAVEKRYRRWFEYVKEYFINTPVMLPDGSLRWMVGGVPSGSALTQLMDSIINYMIINFLAVRTGHGVYDTRVLGDDGKLDIAGRPNLEHWAKLLFHWFGMTLSVKKTRIFGRRFGQKGFLGYDLRSGVLTRPREEFFRLLAHPEREVDSLTKSFTRLTAYMFLGGVNDLRFCQFFEFFQSCYPLDDVAPEFDYDVRQKMMYAGLEIPIKTLRQYTVDDFRNGPFGYNR